MSIPGAKGPLLPARSNPVGPGITPGPGPGARPPIGPRPSTPSQRAATVGGPPPREGGRPPSMMSSVAQRPRSMSLPATMMRRDSQPGGEGGPQAPGAHGQAGKPGGALQPQRPPLMPMPFSRPSLNSSTALARPTLGAAKPIGQGGGQTQATSAASEIAELDSQISQLLDQLESQTRQLRELHQHGADKNDPTKLMEEIQKTLDKLIELNEKRNAAMEKAGQSFAQAAQTQPQG